MKKWILYYVGYHDIFLDSGDNTKISQPTYLLDPMKIQRSAFEAFTSLHAFSKYKK